MKDEKPKPKVPTCEYHPDRPSVENTRWCAACREEILKLPHAGYKERK